ncbi:putative metallo-hydrolase YycJ [Peptococcaceae bacterium CEB3]|nr:putative metallo-hydrolase YycJ [Peptococcaceae bacterium CEB3]
MHFATLASGSSGNAILVGEGDRGFVVDCGISAKRLVGNLAILHVPPEQIEGIIVTHEHIDHIKGIGVLARKLKIPILATAGLWEEIGLAAGPLKDEQKIIIPEEVSLAGLDIKLFPTSHDSRESYGLKITRQTAGKKRLTLGIATDSGTVTQVMHEHLRGCDALVVEANHDEEKLWQGRYPWPLKRRIAGIYGHLENSQIAEGLLSWIGENTQRVVLAHLSEENNTPEAALTAVLRVLRGSHIAKENPELRLRVAPRHTPHELIYLREE